MTTYGTKPPTLTGGAREQEVTDRHSAGRAREERQAAVATWLLHAAKDESVGRVQWQEGGVALLQCGVQFSAVRIPASLIWAAARTEVLRRVDEWLRLQFGPDGSGFMDLHSHMYFLLVPPTTECYWTDRQLPGIEFLGRGRCDHYVGVPAVHRTTPVGRGYWCLPMMSPGTLCHADDVEQLLESSRMLREGRELARHGKPAGRRG
jgi:hypothetical protein